MRRCQTLTVPLLLVCVSLCMSCPAFAGGADRAAQLVSTMFPGSRVVQARQRDRRTGEMITAPRVLPLKRKGHRGYAENFWLQPVKGGAILAFEMNLATIPREAVAPWAETGKLAPSWHQQLLAVVRVDEQGKFKAKPEGFPLLTEVKLNCERRGEVIRAYEIDRGDLAVTVRQHCEPRACPEECKKLGITRPGQTVEREVDLSGIF